VSSKISTNIRILPVSVESNIWLFLWVFFVVCVAFGMGGVKCVTIILYSNQLQIIHSWKYAECLNM
jgi:hypothetical protein